MKKQKTSKKWVCIHPWIEAVVCRLYSGAINSRYTVGGINSRYTVFEIPINKGIIGKM